jgi:hypothetical protein
MTCRHDDRIRHRPVGMKSRSEPRTERTGIGYLAWERGLRCSLERIDRRADGRVEVVFVDPLCDPGGAERLRIGPFKRGYTNVMSSAPMSAIVCFKAATPVASTCVSASASNTTHRTGVGAHLGSGEAPTNHPFGMNRRKAQEEEDFIPTG